MWMGDSDKQVEFHVGFSGERGHLRAEHWGSESLRGKGPLTIVLSSTVEGRAQEGLAGVRGL
jgi:hypothetical protein